MKKYSEIKGSNYSTLDSLEWTLYDQGYLFVAESGYIGVSEGDGKIKHITYLLSNYLRVSLEEETIEDRILIYYLLLKPIFNMIILQDADKFKNVLDFDFEYDSGTDENIFIMVEGILNIYDSFWDIICDNGFEGFDTNQDRIWDDTDLDLISEVLIGLLVHIYSETDVMDNILWVALLGIVKNNFEDFKDIGSTNEFSELFFGKYINRLMDILSSKRHFFTDDESDDKWDYLY